VLFSYHTLTYFHLVRGEWFQCTVFSSLREWQAKFSLYATDVNPLSLPVNLARYAQQSVIKAHVLFILDMRVFPPMQVAFTEALKHKSN